MLDSFPARCSNLGSLVLGALLAVTVNLVTLPVKAVQPDEVLQDPALESRAPRADSECCAWTTASGCAASASAKARGAAKRLRPATTSRCTINPVAPKPTRKLNSTRGESHDQM